MSNKTKAKTAPKNSTVRIRVLATTERAADELAGRSNLNKSEILGLAAAEGMPILKTKLAAFNAA